MHAVLDVASQYARQLAVGIPTSPTGTMAGTAGTVSVAAPAVNYLSTSTLQLLFAQ